MGTLNDHKTKWSHNRSFLGTINDTYADWMVVVMFYTALHAVETLFAHDKTNKHNSHMDRNKTLRSVNRYAKVWEHYRALHDAARTMRYEPEKIEWIAIERVKGHFLPHLYRLENSVLKLLESEDELPPIWPS